MGMLFLTFAAVASAIGALVLLRPRPWMIDAVGLLCGAALVTYAATRLVAFPQIGDDVGNWFEPWGVASVALEAFVVAVASVSRSAVAAAWPSAAPAPAHGRGAPRRVAA